LEGVVGGGRVAEGVAARPENEGAAAAHQFGKCVLVPVLGVAPEQFPVGGVGVGGREAAE
jgi:hypothetical protein